MPSTSKSACCLVTRVSCDEQLHINVWCLSSANFTILNSYLTCIGRVVQIANHANHEVLKRGDSRWIARHPINPESPKLIYNVTNSAVRTSTLLLLRWAEPSHIQYYFGHDETQMAGNVSQPRNWRCWDANGSIKDICFKFIRSLKKWCKNCSLKFLWHRLQWLLYF